MPLNEEHEDEVTKLIYREQNWLVIEDIHMAKPSWLQNLTRMLAKRQSTKGIRNIKNVNNDNNN